MGRDRGARKAAAATRATLARVVAFLWVAAMCLVPGPARAARDQLVIGISQFPSSLHPSINPEASKAYVLGFANRPISGFDKDWKLVCHLCAELPSLENGLARLETRADGSTGMAIRLKLKPGLRWGDGVAVTSEDIAFTFKVGSDPRSGYAL